MIDPSELLCFMFATCLFRVDACLSHVRLPVCPFWAPVYLLLTPVCLVLQADASLELEQRQFDQASLDYVCLLQEVQQRKKFEFVETVSVKAAGVYERVAKFVASLLSVEGGSGFDRSESFVTGKLHCANGRLL